MTTETSIATETPEASEVPEEQLIEMVETPAVEGEQEEAKPEKPEKTPEQREIDRLRRGIDRRTRQLAEARAQIGLTRNPSAAPNAPQDDEPVSLTKAQIAELVKAEAEKLAPALREKTAEVERRSGVVAKLEKAWGSEKFDELSTELDDVFGGLSKANGTPKAATEAIFEADDPQRVIEWMTDPDNAERAEEISRLGPVQAGKAIAKLEASFEPQKPKPQISKAAPPLESIRGKGTVSSAPDPSDTARWIKWRNEQQRRG